jgi:spore germination protein GerM
MRSGRRIGQVRSRSVGSAWGWGIVSLLLVLGGGTLWWLVDLPGGRGTLPYTADRGGNAAPGEELSIWFASQQEDALVLEKRRVPPSLTALDRAKASLQELIAGPTSHALRTIPTEVKIRELFIDDQKTAYIDFSEALTQTHPGGPWAEMLTIRSIMQTLVANVPEIKRVQIIIEGREMETLAGHIDIRRPLDATWVMNHR